MKQKSNKKQVKKIFCVGWCKTGTTSLHHALERLGFKTPESIGLEALELIENNKYEDLWEIIDEYDYFCDYPWFYKGLYEKLDRKYPDSLFILTTRDEKSWHASTKKWFKRGNKSEHPIIKSIYGGSIDSCVPLYKSHNNDVKEYFKEKEGRFLEFNVFKGDGWQKLCDFLHLNNPHRGEKFLWKNKQ